jgi:hypothetical protein
MRALAVTIVFGLLMIFPPATAQDRKPQPASPGASASKPPPVQESEAQAAERKKAEELAKARQRRMDRLSRSISHGNWSVKMLVRAMAECG